MAQNSSIEWCDHTFNPVRGCTKVSPGCANCYAARDAVRFPGIRGVWGDAGTRVVAVPAAWREPLRWDRKAREAKLARDEGALAEGHRPRVFCASLGDVFEAWGGELRFPAAAVEAGYVVAGWNGRELVRELPGMLPVATMDHLRLDLFRLIQATPHLDWLLLTKRPQHVIPMVEQVIRILESAADWEALPNEAPPVVLRNWLADWMIGKAPANLWLGTTAENQALADERIPQLLKIPAKVRFLSCEPLLGPVDLTAVKQCPSPGFFGDCLQWHHRGKCHVDAGVDYPRIHWVIAGGESGPHARPMHPAWARSLRDQCAAARVPFFFKQWGEWTQGRDNLVPAHQFQDGTFVSRLGKARAGRLLDGLAWNRFPNEEGAA